MNKYLVAAVLLLCSGGAFAQDPLGTLTGVVTNHNGARMPGVTVSVHNVFTRATISTLTNEAGDFSLLVGPEANYTLNFKLEGFHLNRIRSVDGNFARLDVRLSADKPVPASASGLKGTWVIDGPVGAHKNVMDSMRLLTPHGISGLMTRHAVNSLIMITLSADNTGLTGNVVEITKISGFKDVPTRDTPGVRDEIAGIEGAEVTGTKFEFMTYSTVNNVGVETVYKGELVDGNTLKVLRSTTTGQPVDLKSDGTAETLFFHRSPEFRFSSW